mmetsp:Transcript_25439/g.61526  ORF Transcript_25439/g.61526 Transcript_25439/m.61526 type:complete len:218 (-) Transcript_25439:60-713(-)
MGTIHNVVHHLDRVAGPQRSNVPHLARESLHPRLYTVDHCRITTHHTGDSSSVSTTRATTHWAIHHVQPLFRQSRPDTLSLRWVSGSAINQNSAGRQHSRELICQPANLLRSRQASQHNIAPPQILECVDGLRRALPRQQPSLLRCPVPQQHRAPRRMSRRRHVPAHRATHSPQASEGHPCTSWDFLNHLRGSRSPGGAGRPRGTQDGIQGMRRQRR